MIPYGRQTISDEDVEAVVGVLRSDFLTQGPAVPRFEHAVTGYCGSRHAVAVNSATSALHIACMALEVGPGDRVWTSPNTFVASANCALYCGATVDFVDIDPQTYNVSIEALSDKLQRAERERKLPKVFIPVHFGGLPCDMSAIGSLARRYGFKVIEDASHAIGARYGDSIIGDCRYCDIAVFSFHPVKIVTTAEGGMALTNDDTLAERMNRLRTHGITRNVAEMSGPSHGPWYYEQVELGYNYRMTDLQAALGLSQAARLNEFVDRRRLLADGYKRALAELPLRVQSEPEGYRSAYHLYVVRISTKEIRASHREVFDSLRGAGIGVNLHYIPVHLQPYYQRLGFKRGDYPEAERYYAEAISLPLYFLLTDTLQDQVVGALRNALQ